MTPTLLLSIALKPVVGGFMILGYRYTLYLIRRYLPRKVADFLLKQR